MVKKTSAKVNKRSRGVKGSNKFVPKSGFLKGLLIKGGITIASVALIAGVGLEVAASITGDEDLSVAARLQDFLDGVKNEEMGCCLPYCGEAKKTICLQSGGEDWTSKSCSQVDDCEEVCCYPYGMMSKKMCEEQADGQVAGEEECEQGFSGRLYVKDSKSVGYDTDGEWEMTMSIFTCEEDWMNGKYTGTWNWDWSIKTPESNGFVKVDKAADDFAFQVDGGQTNFRLGIENAKVSISEDRSVEISFFMANLGENISLTGNLVKGGANCNDEIPN